MPPSTPGFFKTFYRTLKSEGFNDGEACELAQRGADLLTASNAPTDRASEEPANDSLDGKAADNTFPDRPYTYFFSPDSSSPAAWRSPCSLYCLR